MKKRILAALVASAAVLSLAGCNNGGASSSNNSSSSSSSNNGSSNTSTDTPAAPADNSGKKLRIACWNYEFAEFFNAYYKDKLPAGIEVEWVQKPNESGTYQEYLDSLLEANETATGDKKIDMFLAEADYIKKYVNSDWSLDVKSIGVTDTSNAYQYVLDAATTDSGNVLKGVSFQACPGAVIVRKSIAKTVLSTDDPAEIQSKIDSWDKFNAVAKDAKAAGYLMTPSAIETYRAFANNATTSYLDANNKFAPTEAFNSWYAQAKDFVDNGYTLTCKLWDQEKTNEMMKDGKAMCFFGPSWYYNFCMGAAQEDCPGDWCVVQGPQAYFWGGTWMLAAKGTDNTDLVAQVMNAFTNDAEVMEKLLLGKGIKEFSKDGVPTEKDKFNPAFPNNKAIVKKYAEDASYGNEFLGGQNDIAMMSGIADNVKWIKENHTVYDQTFNEALPEAMLQSLIKESGVSEEVAWTNFYKTLASVDPRITH